METIERSVESFFSRSSDLLPILRARLSVVIFIEFNPDTKIENITSILKHEAAETINR